VCSDSVGFRDLIVIDSFLRALSVVAITYGVYLFIY
jgi:hypothetical protein